MVAAVRAAPGPYEPDELSPARRGTEFAADEIAARLRITRRSAELKLATSPAAGNRPTGATSTTACLFRTGQPARPT